MFNYLTKYHLIIDWEGETFHHWAKTRKEAIEWFCCYPIGVGATCTLRGKLVFSRF